MAVRLDLYRIFRHVARNASFSAAAKQLFMTQSAVSQAIRQLETELGAELFVRSKKGAQLTAQGQALDEYVQTALGLIETGEEKVQNMSRLAIGELRIGAGDTISKYLLLSPLEKFNRAYPQINLQIINRTSLETLSLLKSGKIDVAFLNLPIEDASFEVQLSLPVHDVFVCASRWVVPGKSAYSPEEIAAMPLILLEDIANSRKYINRFFLSHGISLKPEIELGSHDLLLEFANIRLGVSCVVREFSRAYLDSGLLTELPVYPPLPPREIGVCSLRGVTLAPPAQAFMNLLRESGLL